jgi:hypothetical protein
MQVRVAKKAIADFVISELLIKSLHLVIPNRRAAKGEEPAVLSFDKSAIINQQSSIHVSES